MLALVIPVPWRVYGIWRNILISNSVDCQSPFGVLFVDRQVICGKHSCGLFVSYKYKKVLPKNVDSLPKSADWNRVSTLTL